MRVEKRIVLTEQEKNLVIYLRDKFEYLLKDEDDFNGREVTDALYEALCAFCEKCL